MTGSMLGNTSAPGRLFHHFLEYRRNFLLGKHRRQTAWSFGVRNGSVIWPGLMQDVAGQEEECIQGDILGRSCHLGMNGETGQKCLHFGSGR
jgi:hypothetical protein